jgi:hypothetical protein
LANTFNLEALESIVAVSVDYPHKLPTECMQEVAQDREDGTQLDLSLAFFWKLNCQLQ